MTTTDYKPVTLEPFVCINDHESAVAFSKGFHDAGGKINPVRRIRFGYPLASWYETGEEETFELPTRPVTLSHVFASIFNKLNKLEANEKLGAPHLVDDYCIECIHIDRRGTCFIEFGS